MLAIMFHTSSGELLEFGSMHGIGNVWFGVCARFKGPCDEDVGGMVRNTGK